VADLSLHGPLLLEARNDAQRILAEDPGFLRPSNAVIGRVLRGEVPALWTAGLDGVPEGG
jgi:hypothetical protein